MMSEATAPVWYDGAAVVAVAENHARQVTQVVEIGPVMAQVVHADHSFHGLAGDPRARLQRNGEVFRGPVMSPARTMGSSTPG